ncbi:hypothetical protein As57867_002263, partial [Aphanomyces stellatus]
MTKRDECPNCQFSLFDPATGNCKVCDFIQNKQRARPCSACHKPNCQFFCDTCGSGYHRRCAEKNRVHMVPLDDNEVSVVCPSCEKDEGSADVNCGGCHKEFSNEDAGLQVGQLVLVEFDNVLYNAVVMEVNEPETSVKIHFVRWSKSFDGWYKMDDERVNESLACDGCNQWFHINCLPPIKSSGRYKAASYVCESCFKDAKSHRTKGGKPSGGASTINTIEPKKEQSDKRTTQKVISDDSGDDDDDEDDSDEDDDAGDDEDDAIVLSPSALVHLPELPKRKVGRPSHKQLEAERQALAKRKALLKSMKDGKDTKTDVSPDPPTTTMKRKDTMPPPAKEPKESSNTKKDASKEKRDPSPKEKKDPPPKEKKDPRKDTKKDPPAAKSEKREPTKDPEPPVARVAKSPRLRDSAKATAEKQPSTPSPPPPSSQPTQPPSPKQQTRKPPADRSAPPPPPPSSSPKQRKTKSRPSPKLAKATPVKVPSPIATDDDSSSSEDEEVAKEPVKKKKKLRDNQTETDLPLVTPMLPLQRIHVPHSTKSNSNSSLILLSTLLNSPRYDKHNQENCPPRNVTPLDIL